jgi:hypothetical protein
VLYPFGDLSGFLCHCLLLQGPGTGLGFIKEQALRHEAFINFYYSANVCGSSTEHLRYSRKIGRNKKGAFLSSEDENAPSVCKIPDARMRIHLFGNPAILIGQDPWLCVTRLLWFCLFGELLFTCYIAIIIYPKE